MTDNQKMLAGLTNRIEMLQADITIMKERLEQYEINLKDALKKKRDLEKKMKG